MKNIFIKSISVLFLLVISFYCKAQFYVNSNTSYGLSLAPMTISANYSPNKVESVKSSFGKGFDFGVGAGYHFNKNIAAEIDFTYLIGGKIKFTDSSNPSTPAETEELSATMFRIIPTLKFSGGEKFKPYAKIGLVIGLGTRLKDESVNYFASWTGSVEKYEETVIFSGGTSLGMKGNVGLDYSISEKFGVFAEINFISQAWAPKKAETTRYLLNGEDKLATLDVRDKETEFVDSYNPNETIQPNQPNKSLKLYLPFSSWGANIGIKFTFRKKE